MTAVAVVVGTVVLGALLRAERIAEFAGRCWRELRGKPCRCEWCAHSLPQTSRKWLGK